MSERKEGRYFVLRYMVGDLRDEAINIGIVGIDEERGEYKMRLLEELGTKARVDAPFDQQAVAIYKDNVTTLLQQAQTQLPADLSAIDILKSRLSEAGGNLIRAQGPLTVLTDNMDVEIDHLYDEWVAPRVRRVRAVLGGPRDPLGGLRRDAHAAITRQIRRSLPIDFRRTSFRSEHEVRGKKHVTVFDAALVVRRRAHTVEHLFHHVLLLPDAEESFNQAAALLWKWNDVQAKNGRERDLTAVLFSREGLKREGVKAARNVLEKDKVRVAEVAEVPDIVRDVHPQLRIPM